MKYSFRTELIRGATEASWLALAVTFLVAGAWMIVATVMVGPEALLGQEDESSLAQDASDLYFFATAKAYSLGASEPTTASVVIMSNSSHLFAFPSESALASGIELTSGIRPEVHRLVAGALTLWEMRSLAEIAGPGIGGIVVIGVGPLVLSAGPERLQRILDRPRLGMVAGAFDEEAMRLGLQAPRRTSNYFIDNHIFLLARLPSLMKHAFKGERVRDWSEERRQHARTSTDWIEKAVQRDMRAFAENHSANLEVLERLIEQLRAAGAGPIVLLEMLRNPARQTYSVSDLAIYRMAITDLADREQVVYWNLDREARLDPEDFIDYTHLGNIDAAARYRRSLAQRLGPLIGMRVAGAGS